MAFAKGNKAGKGRPKGVQNKSTRTAKEAFQFAFDELGGAQGLVKWALKDPDNEHAFYTLYARLIPTDTNLNVKTVDVEFI